MKTCGEPSSKRMTRRQGTRTPGADIRESTPLTPLLVATPWQHPRRNRSSSPSRNPALHARSGHHGHHEHPAGQIGDLASTSGRYAARVAVDPFSLKGGRLSSVGVCCCWFSRLVGDGAHFSFGAGAHTVSVGAASASQFSAGPQAAKGVMELAETRWLERGRVDLNGWLRASTCQAEIRTLRATALLAGFLPWRLATSL